jgi:hypothetical protein
MADTRAKALQLAQELVREPRQISPALLAMRELVTDPALRATPIRDAHQAQKRLRPDPPLRGAPTGSPFVSENQEKTKKLGSSRRGARRLARLRVRGTTTRTQDDQETNHVPADAS